MAVRCDTEFGPGNVLASRRMPYGSLSLYIQSSVFEGWFDENEIHGLPANCSFCHEGAMVPNNPDVIDGDPTDLICTACETVVGNEAHPVIPKSVSARTAMSYTGEFDDDLVPADGVAARDIEDELEDHEDDSDLRPHWSGDPTSFTAASDPRDQAIHDPDRGWVWHRTGQPLTDEELQSVQEEDRQNWTPPRPGRRAALDTGWIAEDGAPRMKEIEPKEPEKVDLFGVGYSNAEEKFASVVTDPERGEPIFDGRAWLWSNTGDKLNYDERQKHPQKVDPNQVIDHRTSSQGPAGVGALDPGNDVRYDPERQIWVRASDGGELSFEEAQALGLDATLRTNPHLYGPRESAAQVSSARVVSYEPSEPSTPPVCRNCGSNQVTASKDSPAPYICASCGVGVDDNGYPDIVSWINQAGYGPIHAYDDPSEWSDSNWRYEQEQANQKPDGNCPNCGGKTYGGKCDSCDLGHTSAYRVGQLIALAQDEDESDKYYHWLQDRQNRDDFGGKEDYWKGFSSPGGADLNYYPDEVQQGARNAYDEGWDRQGPDRGLADARKVIDDHWNNQYKTSRRIQAKGDENYSVNDSPCCGEVGHRPDDRGDFFCQACGKTFESPSLADHKRTSKKASYGENDEDKCYECGRQMSGEEITDPDDPYRGSFKPEICEDCENDYQKQQSNRDGWVVRDVGTPENPGQNMAWVEKGLDALHRNDPTYSAIQGENPISRSDLETTVDVYNRAEVQPPYEEEMHIQEARQAGMIHEAPGGGTHKPYKIVEEGGRFYVENSLGERKEENGYSTREEARNHQKALYANTFYVGDLVEDYRGEKAQVIATHISGKLVRVAWADGTPDPIGYSTDIFKVVGWSMPGLPKMPKVPSVPGVGDKVDDPFGGDSQDLSGQARPAVGGDDPFGSGPFQQTPRPSGEQWGTYNKDFDFSQYRNSKVGAGGPVGMPKIPTPPKPGNIAPAVKDPWIQTDREPAVQPDAGRTHWKTADTFIESMNLRQAYWEGLYTAGADLFTSEEITRRARKAFDEGYTASGPDAAMGQAISVLIRSQGSEGSLHRHAVRAERQLASYGLRREAAFVRVAHWRDVRAKALRLRREGNVHVESFTPQIIYGKVEGDHGTYDVVIHRLGSGPSLDYSVSNWNCKCEWGQWAWNRRRFFGRMCSHALAMYHEMQSRHQIKPGSRRWQRYQREQNSRNIQSLGGFGDSSIKQCPKCGTGKINPNSLGPTCDNCGFWSLNDEVLDKLPDHPDQTGSQKKQSALECLKCGDPLMSTDASCPNCGELVSRSEQDSNWGGLADHPDRKGPGHTASDKSTGFMCDKNYHTFGKDEEHVEAGEPCPRCEGTLKPAYFGHPGDNRWPGDTNYPRTSAIFDGVDTTDGIGSGNSEGLMGTVECLECGDPLMGTDANCPNCGALVSQSEQASNWGPEDIQHPNKRGQGHTSGVKKTSEKFLSLTEWQKQHPDEYDDFSRHKEFACKNHPNSRFTSKNPRERSIFPKAGTEDCGCPFTEENLRYVEGGDHDPKHTVSGVEPWVGDNRMPGDRQQDDWAQSQPNFYGCPYCGEDQENDEGLEYHITESHPQHFSFKQVMTNWMVAASSCPDCGSGDTRMTEHEFDPIECNGCGSRFGSLKTAKPRAGGDKRGSAASRRARKQWLLSPESGFGGDGQRVPCVHCGEDLDFNSVEADRKEAGGPYARHNVQPSCRRCNLERSNKPEWTSPYGPGAQAVAGRRPKPGPDPDYGRDAYWSLADEMNDVGVPPWRDDDWDPTAVEHARSYAESEGHPFPPPTGYYDEGWAQNMLPHQDSRRQGSVKKTSEAQPFEGQCRYCGTDLVQADTTGFGNYYDANGQSKVGDPKDDNSRYHNHAPMDRDDMVPVGTPNVHTYPSTYEAYDDAMTNEAVKDGDILHVPDEGVTGYLHRAWPVAIKTNNGDPGAFHTLIEGAEPDYADRGRYDHIVEQINGMDDAGSANTPREAPWMEQDRATRQSAHQKQGYEFPYNTVHPDNRSAPLQKTIDRPVQGEDGVPWEGKHDESWLNETHDPGLTLLTCPQCGLEYPASEIEYNPGNLEDDLICPNCSHMGPESDWTHREASLDEAIATGLIGDDRSIGGPMQGDMLSPEQYGAGPGNPVEPAINTNMMLDNPNLGDLAPQNEQNLLGLDDNAQQRPTGLSPQQPNRQPLMQTSGGIDDDDDLMDELEHGPRRPAPETDGGGEGNMPESVAAIFAQAGVNPEYLLEAEPGSDDQKMAAAMEEHIAKLTKTSGRAYSPAEQSALINEPGVASNAGGLKLEGTHYVEADLDLLDDSNAFL